MMYSAYKLNKQGDDTIIDESSKHHVEQKHDTENFSQYDINFMKPKSKPLQVSIETHTYYLIWEGE